MTKSPIVINGNTLSAKVHLSNEQYYFVNRFCWTSLTLEGKDARLSEEVSQAVQLDYQKVIIDLRVSSETKISDAYDQMLALQDQVQTALETVFAKFREAAPNLQHNLDLTLAALGLIELED